MRTLFSILVLFLFSLVSFLFLLISSCNQKQDQTDYLESGITEIDYKKPNMAFVENTKSNLIIGIYYVGDFYKYLETGFTLKSKKPNENAFIYKFEFTENGSIKFTDLTKSYECGNGILTINKGLWSKNKKGNYVLLFHGEYALESIFKTKSEYELITLKNGDTYMKLKKIIINSKNPAW